MASVTHFHYEFSDSNGFAPGTSRGFFFGPYAWNQSAVLVNAHPFDASGSDRTLVVTEVRRRTTPDQFVEITVRNTGRDTMYIWYVELGLISP
ncbi:hypothetical protein ABZ419_16765 [Streptomyces cinnamoneus]|uniref:Uncharacterized protein n=1 Tax=Streptomyces cinnamoneus TaxID=53446 RepID=A0A918TSP8_STRCJ|nr:hypothetical protein [Streptomyces cinnamoneus]GHC60214.1 hypothetical protein GCM10010507_41600 [Streptomyces cinnamoneus]